MDLMRDYTKGQSRGTNKVPIGTKEEILSLPGGIQEAIINKVVILDLL